MIKIAKYGSTALVNGNLYLAKLITAVIIGGDVVRVMFDGDKIIARPFVEFVNRKDELFASAEEVKTYVDRINGSHKKFKVQNIADETVTGKDHRSINYVTELKDGVRLHKKYDIDEVTGFLKATDYYKDFDGNTHSNKILRVEETYEVDSEEPIINAKKATSRTKVRKYTLQDTGEIDQTETKTTTKFYTEKGQTRNEGQRRRHNVQLILEDRIGLVLLLTGVAPDTTDVYSKLVKFIQDHNAAFTAWIESGRGDIFLNVENDVKHFWLTQTIPDLPQTQALLPNSIGVSLRTFIVERLKGNK